MTKRQIIKQINEAKKTQSGVAFDYNGCFYEIELDVDDTLPCYSYPDFGEGKFIGSVNSFDEIGNIILDKGKTILELASEIASFGSIL